MIGENVAITTELKMILDSMKESVILLKEQQLSYVNNTCQQMFSQKRIV